MGLFSIHALREEGDAHKTVKENRKAYFYPRPPRGGRLTREYYYSGREQFLSTPSARRATEHIRAEVRRHQISIHALREEGDPTVAAALQAKTEFLSTPSARRATQCRPAYP